MKKILLTGKLNTILKNVDQALSSFFHVQICELKTETIEGMLRVIEPDLVIICLVGTKDYDTSVFEKLEDKYRSLPVLTVGTEAEKRAFLKFYEDKQFENLTRPVSNSEILTAVCNKLGLEYVVKNGIAMIQEIGAKKNVLVVDDNVVTLRALKQMLDPEYDISVATSGVKAMTAIGKRRPDLILMDYEMPVCNGRQTLEMIRGDEDLRDIPVIFLTGAGDRQHIESVLRLRPAGYLLKPAVRDKVLEAIQQQI